MQYIIKIRNRKNIYSYKNLFFLLQNSALLVVTRNVDVINHIKATSKAGLGSSKCINIGYCFKSPYSVSYIQFKSQLEYVYIPLF